MGLFDFGPLTSEPLKYAPAPKPLPGKKARYNADVVAPKKEDKFSYDLKRFLKRFYRRVKEAISEDESLMSLKKATRKSTLPNRIKSNQIKCYSKTQLNSNPFENSSSTNDVSGLQAGHWTPDRSTTELFQTQYIDEDSGALGSIHDSSRSYNTNSSKKSENIGDDHEEKRSSSRNGHGSRMLSAANILSQTMPAGKLVTSVMDDKSKDTKGEVPRTLP